jgi:predicted permease
LSGTITVDSRAVAPDLASPEADQCLVTPAYFQAMGIPVLSGRAFEARDADPSQPVAIIDETLAKVFWPKESAIGKCLRRPGENAPWATIIGVVRHVRNRTLEAPSRIQVYWPADQTAERSLTLAIRTKVPPRSLATSVQREIAAVDPEQPAYSIKTMEEWMEDSLALRRLGTLLLSVFSGVALALAAVGIYGVVGFSVSQRTREIGLRVALGARKTDVLGLILKQGLLLAGIGGALGMLGAAATTRLLGSLLYQVQPTDPASFALGALVMGTVALLACYFPARRAAKVDPVVALRSD